MKFASKEPKRIFLERKLKAGNEIESEARKNRVRNTICWCF